MLSDCLIRVGEESRLEGAARRRPKRNNHDVDEDPDPAHFALIEAIQGAPIGASQLRGRRMIATRLLGAVLVSSMAVSAQTTWYVDDDAPDDPGPGDSTVSDPLEDGTTAHPFDMVQEGIDAADHGDTVLALAGTYVENINFTGKAIVVRSESGADATVLDGSGGTVVAFRSNEGLGSVLDGFTVTNGYGSYIPPMNWTGGGVLCWPGSPTIRNNVITANVAEIGAAISCYQSSARIDSNIIVNNSTHLGIGSSAAGIHCYDSAALVITNNVFASNSSDYGTGLRIVDCSPTVQGNTFWANTGQDVIHCDFMASPEILNSIFWDGATTEIVGAGAVVSYCDVKGGWTGSGIGNIDAEPLFVNAAGGDYRLQQHPCQTGVINPCVDAGDPTSPMIEGTTRTDLVQDGGIVDMGYHYERLQASCQWYCGSGINMDTYTVSNGFELGGTFRGTVGISPPNIGAIIAGYPSGALFPIWGQEGLVNVLHGEMLGFPGGFIPAPITITWSVPGDPAYAGYHVHTQAAGIGGGVINLTCAFDCTAGY